MVSSTTPSGTKRGARGSSDTTSAKRSPSAGLVPASPLGGALPPLPPTTPVPALPVVQLQTPQQTPQQFSVASPQASPQALSPFAQQGGARGPPGPGGTYGSPATEEARLAHAQSMPVPGEGARTTMNVAQQLVQCSYEDVLSMDVGTFMHIDVDVQAETINFAQQNVETQQNLHVHQTQVGISAP